MANYPTQSYGQPGQPMYQSQAPPNQSYGQPMYQPQAPPANQPYGQPGQPMYQSQGPPANQPYGQPGQPMYQSQGPPPPSPQFSQPGMNQQVNQSTPASTQPVNQSGGGNAGFGMGQRQGQRNNMVGLAKWGIGAYIASFVCIIFAYVVLPLIIFFYFFFKTANQVSTASTKATNNFPNNPYHQG